MKTPEHKRSSPADERRDWLIVLLILLFGLMCILITGQWALRFTPSWKLDADMESRLDPNSDFLTRRPSGFIEPIDPSILTQPVWIDVFLTPGAIFPTRTIPLTSRATLPVQQTATLPAVVTATNIVAVTTSPTNTFVYYPPPPTSTPRPRKTSIPTVIAATPTATLTPSITPELVADLQITKTDNVTGYARGGSTIYTIIVSNPGGPDDAIGATVIDDLSTNTNISNSSWTCSTTGSATCTASGSGDINDIVNIPVGSSLTYTVTANLVSSPSGDLLNTVTLVAPPGLIDPSTGNNAAIDTNTLLMGTTPDGNVYDLLAGGILTLNIPVEADGDPDPDLVYYELPAGSGILLDWVIIEIGDGNNWYTIFNWGDNNPDANTDVGAYIQSNPQVPQEPDQRNIPSSALIYSTGVAIDVDSVVPPGTYSYIRLYAPTGDVDGQLEVDALEVLP